MICEEGLPAKFCRNQAGETYPNGIAQFFFGEVAERSKAAVLKTVKGQPFQSSNLCLSAIFARSVLLRFTTRKQLESRYGQKGQ